MRQGRTNWLRYFSILFIILGMSEIIFASNNYDGLIFKYASKYGLDPYLVKGLIKTESSFNPNAVSSAGAIGLTQIMPETGRLLGYSKRELYNPEKNIAASCKFLSFLKKKASQHGWDSEYTRKKMLQGYYAGPGYIGKPGIDLYHMVYVNKVLKNYYGFKAQSTFAQGNYTNYNKNIKVKSVKKSVFKRLNRKINKKFTSTHYYVGNTHTKLNNNNFEYFKSMRREYNKITEENIQAYNEVKDQAQKEFQAIHDQMGKSSAQNIKKNETTINMKVVKLQNEVKIIFKSEEDKEKFLSLPLADKLKMLEKR